MFIVMRYMMFLYQGAKIMKVTTGLYIFLVLIHFINFTNITLFNGEWNGITMWLSTGLFIAGTTYYLLDKKAIPKKEIKKVE